MTDESENQSQQDEESPFDFDNITIHIAIDDEIVTGEEFHHNYMISPAELDLNPDALEDNLLLGMKEMIREYRIHRSEMDDDE